MNLKQTILAVMGRDDLKAAIHVAGLDEVDRRRVRSMREALSGSRGVKPAQLLDAMSEAQVKDVCERMGIDRTGRKNALIQRLLNGKPKAVTVEASPDDDVEAGRPAKPAPLSHAKISVTKTELVWPGKYNEDGTLREVPRVSLPFQVIETVNESRATRDATQPGTQATLFDVYEGTEGDTFEDGWRNKLIWGDNLLVMGSLLEKFAGKIDLIYIDPPFATGADFSFSAHVGEGNTNLTKEQSIIEEKAYRDTWGRGLHSFLDMMTDRLHLLRDLLSPSGSIFVHLDPNTSFLIRQVMDEIFGSDCFCNHIIWSYKRWRGTQNVFQRMHDDILFYRKMRKNDEHVFNKEYEEVSESYLKRFGGKTQVLDPETGTRKITIDEPTKGLALRDVWDISIVAGVSRERTGYPTQKPEALLERVISTCTDSGDLIADFFCGSGTSLAVAERLNRRWIGCDLGKWGVHVSRKRLLGIKNCKPFDVLNLGKYERQYWQAAMFGGTSASPMMESTLYEYLAFILRLYGARPVPGLSHLHGQKNRAMVHVGSVDAPITIGDIDAAVDECVRLRQKELHVLGWEWEMGLHDLMVSEAKAKGVKLLPLQIPREVMERQAAEKRDVRFFELAYLKAAIQMPRKLTACVKLEDFVIANPELIPSDVRSKVTKWSDYIDYWAVDWDFQHDTFMQGWVTYRTRQDRSLALVSDPYTYPSAGRYRALVKVIDIFGNDTSQLFDVRMR